MRATPLAPRAISDVRARPQPMYLALAPSIAARGVASLRPFCSKRLAPKRDVVPIAQGHGHLLAGSIDGDVTEELQVEGRRQVLALFLCRRLHIHQLRPEGGVKLIWTERARMDWTRHEFPKWLEILEAGLSGIIVVGRCVV